MWWFPLAHAASVAVIDFDAQGQTLASAQLAAEALRSALLEERLLEPLSARDIAELATAGKETELRLGRQKAAEARRLRDAGDARGCADRAGEAGDLLLEAQADVGRRAEVADVYYLQGTCLIIAGNNADAYFAFAEVTRQFPGYLTERATDLGESVVESLALAQAAADAAGPRKRPAERLATLQDRFGVDYVVTGNLDRKGKLTVGLYEAGQLLGEAQVSIRLPPSGADPAFIALAHTLVDSAGVAPGERTVTRAAPSADPEELPALAAPLPDPGEQSEPERGPVAQRWWLWAGAALLAGGGATVVVLLTDDPPPEPTQGPPTWSVQIPTD